MWKTISAGLCGLSFLATPLFSAQTLEQQIGTANDAQNAPTAYGKLLQLNATVNAIYNGVNGFSPSVLSGNLFRATNKIKETLKLGNHSLVDTLFGQQVQFQNGISNLLGGQNGALTQLNTVVGNAIDQNPVTLSGSILSQIQQITNQIPTDTTIGDSLENLGYFDITDFKSLTNWSFVTAPWAELNNTINSVSAVKIKNAQNPNSWQITMSGGSNNTYTTGDLNQLFPGPSNTINIQQGDNILFYGPGSASTIGFIFQYTGSSPIPSISDPTSVFNPDDITLSPPSSLPNAVLALSEAIGYLEPKMDLTQNGALVNWVLTTAPWEEANNTINSIQVNNNQWRITLSSSKTYDTGDLTVLYPPDPNTADQINILTGFNVIFSPTSGIGGNFVFQYTGSSTIRSLTNPVSVFDPRYITLIKPSFAASLISIAQALQLTNPIYGGSNLCQTIGKIRTQVI